jgi:uncharacterized protein YifE (UPF0438 family)
MKQPRDHAAFLARRDFPIPRGEFSEDERALLAKYGRWLEALATGVIPPISPSQERFLSVVRGELEPTTPFEQVWMKVAQQDAIPPDVKVVFDELARARAGAAAMEEEYRAARDVVMARIKDQLQQIDDDFVERLREASETVAAAEAALRALMLKLRHSVKLSGIVATYSRGRITWDSKKLDEYAAIHPEVLEFRKVGKPVVALRFLDQLALPEVDKEQKQDQPPM